MLDAPTILCDLDGTLYTTDQVVPGAAAAIEALRTAGARLRFFTNTDSMSSNELSRKLTRLGFAIDASEIFTPVEAAVRSVDPAANVLFLVPDSLVSAFHPLTQRAGEPITHVIVGDVRERLDYALLDAAFHALRSGAQLLALQRGRYFRGSDRDHIDTGAIVAALEYAAGVEATVLGKPSPAFLNMAAQSVGARVSDVWVVGDDATTDIALGNLVGARTVQVRTGKYHDQFAERLIHSAVDEIASIANLPALLASARRP